jgi:hypothetical protein
MTTDKQNDMHQEPASFKPYAMVGAGRLISTIWKTGDEQTGWHYRFNLFRMSSRGRVGQRFSPADVVSLVKLARVLAAELAADGCLAPAQRTELGGLAAMLDLVTYPQE